MLAAALAVVAGATVLVTASGGCIANPAQIWTVAGTGTSGAAGNNGPATSAQLNDPQGVSPTPDGGFLIADSDNCIVRKVNASGKITVVAGVTGACDGTGTDGTSPTAQELNDPRYVKPTSDGGFLIADEDNCVIRKVNSAGTTMTVVAGVFASCGSGGIDGGMPTSQQLSFPHAVTPTADGGFLVSDTDNCFIRKVNSAGTTMTIVAGNGPCGSNGTGPALSTELNHARGLAARPDGSYLYADTSNCVVRNVSVAGLVTTVAGMPPFNCGGPTNGPATSSDLNRPEDVSLTADGGFLIADENNDAVEKVFGDGTLQISAGDNGCPGTPTASNGDGGPALSATLCQPVGVAASPDGGYLIADRLNNKVRWVAGPQGPTGATGASGNTGATGPSGATGAQGPQGATGPAGTNGTNGTNGAPGPQGPAGTNGANGANGANGTQGAQGNPGPPGPGGPAGPQGPVGPRGPTGTVRCLLSATKNESREHVTCRVAAASSLRRASARLNLHGRTVATGSSVKGRLHLRPVRGAHLRRGHYTLILTGRVGHYMVSSSQVVVLT